MPQTQLLLLNHQRPLIQQLRVGHESLLVRQKRQISQDGARQRGLRTHGPFRNGEGLVQCPLRGGVEPLSLIETAKVVQASG